MWLPVFCLYLWLLHWHNISFCLLLSMSTAYGILWSCFIYMLLFGIILVPIASCIHLLVMVSKGTPHSWRTGLLVLANCCHLDIEEWIPPMGFLPLMLWCPILLCWPFFLWCCTILVWNSDYRLYLSLLSRLRWLSRVSFVLAYLTLTLTQLRRHGRSRLCWVSYRSLIAVNCQTV